MTYPQLEDKNPIINNTDEVCHACGIANPKVAPVAAVEVVNPKMPCTVDADELTKMNAEGKITGCIIDGPLSMDMAIDSAAAAHKGGTDRKIAGDADVILTHLCDVKNGNILTGTAAPVILTSRSDSFEAKLNSIALAAVVAESMKKSK